MPKINMEKLLINLLLFLFSTLIILIFLEITFRITGIGELKDENFVWIKHANYNPFLIFGPNINKQVQHEDGEIEYWNSQGFRLKEDLPKEKNPEEYRIFALGGSTTENSGSKDYCGKANKILENYDFNGKRFSCVNPSKSSYSSAHSLVRLQFDLLEFDPDMVTIMHNINDLIVNFFPYEDDRNNYANTYLHDFFAKRRSVKQLEIIRESRVIVFLWKSTLNVRGKLFAEKVQTDTGTIISTMRFNDKPTELKSKEAFANNLIAIAKIAKAHNITAVFMTEPASFSNEKIVAALGDTQYNKDVLYPPLEEFAQLYEEYNDVIETVAVQEGVYFIDMYNLMGHDEKYFSDVVHYTTDGIDRFSEIYSENLKEIIEKELNKEQ